MASQIDFPKGFCRMCRFPAEQDLCGHCERLMRKHRGDRVVRVVPAKPKRKHFHSKTAYNTAYSRWRYRNDAEYRESKRNWCREYARSVRAEGSTN